MNREDIIRIMRELAGPEYANAEIDEGKLAEFMPLFQAIAAAEREACAKWLDERDAPNWAEQIRARGQA